LIGELHRRGRPIALGTHSLSTLLSERLGISETEARMRIHEAVALGYG
jgi:DNA-binding Lrp family transcriptional regulator